MGRGAGMVANEGGEEGRSCHIYLVDEDPPHPTNQTGRGQQRVKHTFTHVAKNYWKLCFATP